MDYGDLDRAIKEGLLEARRTLDGTDWLIDEGRLREFLDTIGGSNVEDAVEQAILQSRVEEHPDFVVSHILLTVASAVFFLVFVVGVIVIYTSFVRRDMLLGLVGFFMMAVSAGYIVLYDLLRAVFSMHSAMVKIVARVESIDLAVRKTKRSGS